jgi:hypothetical protein
VKPQRQDVNRIGMCDGRLGLARSRLIWFSTSDSQNNAQTLLAGLQCVRGSWVASPDRLRPPAGLLAKS